MTAVEDWLVAHEGEALETLKNFCRIPSVSADPAFGKDIRKAAEFSAGLLTQAGFPQVEIVETGGHPAVVAEWCATPGAPTPPGALAIVILAALAITRRQARPRSA